MQSLGQCGTEQSRPPQPWSHAHVPLRHLPWPEQSSAPPELGQRRSSHATPPHSVSSGCGAGTVESRSSSAARAHAAEPCSCSISLQRTAAESIFARESGPASASASSLCRAVRGRPGWKGLGGACALQMHVPGLSQ